MNEAERRALTALSFNWAPTPDDVWRPSPYHVDGLHPLTEQAVLAGLRQAEHSPDASPIGVAVLGQRGSGKTHLLGWVREQVQAAGGYFFLIQLLETGAFWRSAAHSIVEDLARVRRDGDSQLTSFLRRLSDLVGAPRSVRRAVVGEVELTRSALDAFVDLVRKHDRGLGAECRDTLRAMVLCGAEQFTAQDVGYDLLRSVDEQEPGSRREWGVHHGTAPGQEVVKQVSRLLALTGPTVVAVDQIDLLISQAEKSTAEVDTTDQWRESLLLEQIAGGLMSLRESTRRTVSVLSCLPHTWESLKARATDTVQDRFQVAHRLGTIPTAEFARELIEKRFAPAFGESDFVPPYPSWPVAPEAFPGAVGFTPRELLKTVDAHVRACLLTGEVAPLTELAATAAIDGAGDSTLAAGSEVELRQLDEAFAAAVAAADPAPALAPETEDDVVPGLLAAAFTAWTAEQGAAAPAYRHDPPPGPKPALHGRLRRSLGDDTEDEYHWAFRAVAAGHAIAALNRVRTAVTGAGLTEGVTKRRLYLLRNEKWSPGQRTQEVMGAFAAAGGQTLGFPESDIRVLLALRELLDTADSRSALRRWFALRRPTREVGFLRKALAAGTPAETPAGTPVETPVGTPAADGSGGATGSERPSAPAVPVVPAPRTAEPATAEPATAEPATAEPATAEPATGTPAIGEPPAATVAVGAREGDGAPVWVGLEALRKHTVIFAGSGSGKTVLIRRLVEECALQGVSAIVLDPNNDLARLGDPWPEPPTGWREGDAAKAEEYLAHTDVVVWTPRKEAGRPLSFQPLPAFAAVRDDPDEFAASIDAAVAALAPRARVDTNTQKSQIGLAVLRQSLRYYAEQDGDDLREFIRILGALPPDASHIDGAQKLGAEMARVLTAATVNDPLFGGGGAPVDPDLLLTPPPGKRARVSVISFVGLPGEEQRQSFVNQLQLALFAWIKRNPAGDRPLGGLLVMDEAQTLAPASPATPCTESTLALVAQARKYGLGLVFATQAPKALHNRIPGNAATQFFGLLNAPAQIAAAKEMARSKGSDIPDIARLGAGQFYAAIEGSPFTKLRAPLCLSHHPKSALTAEEVTARAAANSHLP